MSRYAKILWLDLEMTGLDERNDLILEVALIATDWDFNEIATYEGVIRHDDSLLQQKLAANAPFWDANLQARDGLIGQNGDGKTLTEVEGDILKFVGKHFESSEKILLAGNSIHIDRRFIAAQLLVFEKKLHYRMLDVSAWKVVFEGKFKKRFTKPEEHRALGDIRGSIQELQYYLKKIKL